MTSKMLALAAVALVGLMWTTAPAPAQQPDQCRSLVTREFAFAGSPRVVADEVDGVPVNVLLPSDYAVSDRRYPVLYLLHGFTQNEDSWLVHSDVERFTADMTGDRGVIVVMPEGDPTGVDLDYRNGKRTWETLYTTRLIPYVDAHYRTLADRAHRAIAGLSGGGFSTTYLAARHPDLFVAAGSFSGAAAITGPSALSIAFFIAVDRAANNCAGGQPTDEGAVGLPVRDGVWRHDASATALAGNFRGMAIYVASGDGRPCDPQDVSEPASPEIPSPVGRAAIAGAERFIYAAAHDFDVALTAARVPHVGDLYGCGIHSYRYFQRDLHAFWPLMAAAFGTPAPERFDHRRATPQFSVWGWTLTADPNRAAEFLDVRGASCAGLSMTGSGITTVTTGPCFAPGAAVALTGAREPGATADGDGRITFTVELGPPHPNQQYTLQAKLAGQDKPGYFTTTEVRFQP